jgi:hypothetical protein
MMPLWRITGRRCCRRFQQVEDNLAQLRILADEAEIVNRAVRAGQQSLEISTIQYRTGTANYLQVITAQTNMLQNQRAAVDILMRRLVASGFGMMMQMASSNTILQTILPDEKRGRVMSYYTMVFAGMVPFGSLLAGCLANRIGAQILLPTAD